MSEPPRSVCRGPLTGLRVVELASEAGAYAGKLLADFGAEVLLVEPPGGHHTRRFAPSVEELDLTHPDRSLWFWHYNTSKLGVQLDLGSAAGAAQFRYLVKQADIVLEAEPVGSLAVRGLDYQDVSGPESSTIWVSVTSFGRDDARSDDPFTDLTVIAGGGIAWSCGYDDPETPPMRPLGDQSFHIAGVWAAIAALTAVRARAKSGRGQLVDVSMHAAANVTTEQATQWWLVAGKTVRRQTGRHASHVPTEEIVQLDRDGYEVHTGLPPHTPGELARLIAWLDDLDLRAEFPLMVLLELAIEHGGIDLSKLHNDELTQECHRVARGAMTLIASKLTRREFFLEGQTRGFAVGMVLAPDEVLADPHLVARGYLAKVQQPQLGRSVVHAGLPVRFGGTPGEIRPAPRPGEHQDLLLTDHREANP
jgi:crotonobetainyl-CoA:carnitine CoA-transferase CaiB-like acyl-CoA transferase